MEQYTQFTESVNDFHKKSLDLLLSAGYLVGLFFLVTGFYIFITEANRFYKISQINSWPITKNAGQITNSHMETTISSSSYNSFFYKSTTYDLLYRTRVAFNYTVDGTEHHSDKLSYYEPWDSNPMSAKEENSFLKPGTIVNIIVNPKNSAEAYITNKHYNNYVRIIYGFLLFSIGLFIVLKSKNSKNSKKPTKQK